MKIRQIEFIGFKSFADKTAMEFDAGISAIVGPNGCGKSNLLDGLRWVMGEMSAKSLRGKSMQDVIFAGTDARKAISMAEVSMILDNSDQSAPPGYKDYTEIQITRRLYRSGESEYLINKIPCRLKDITELFMDTGLGVKAYSMVEQGQIDRIISSRPQERRTLIEEAAGITKYKAKKDEALRKIDSTQQNLLRIDDLLSEIKRAVNSLARQAGKARRYNRIKQELRDLDLVVASREYAGLTWDADMMAGRADQLMKLIDQESSALEIEDLDIQDQRLKLLELEKKLNGWQGGLFDIQSKIQAAEAENDHLTRESENLNEQIESAENEIAQYSGRISTLELEKERTVNERNALLGVISNAEVDLERLEAEVLTAKESVAGLEQELDQNKAQLVDLLTESASLKSRYESAQSHIEESQQAIGVLRDLRKDLEERRTELSARLEEIGQDLSGLDEKTRDHASNRDDLKSRKLALTDDGRGLSERFETLKKEIESRRVRLNSLKSMQRNLECYQRGVRMILQHADEQSQAPMNIKGVVADFLEIDHQYETAVEAVLGDRLQGVVVDSHQSGMSAAQFLKSEASGRSTFIPMDLREASPNTFSDTALQMAMSPMREVVHVKPGYEPVADYLLGDALLVQDMDTAQQVWKANGYKGLLVTVDGEILDDRGALTGGSPESIQSGILQHKREIKELESEIAGLADTFAEAESAYMMNKGLTEKVSGDLEKTEEELRRLEIDRINITNARDNIEAELRDARRELEQNEQKGKSTEQRMHEDETFVSQASKRLEQIENERRTTGNKVREIDEKLEHSRADLDNQLAEMAERRIEITTDRERLNQLGTTLIGLENQRKDLEQITERRNKSISSSDMRIEQIAAARQELLQTIESLNGDRTEHEQGLKELQNEYNKGQHDLMERERGLKKRTRQLDTMRDEQRSLEIERTEVRLKLQHACDQISERYNMELADIAAQHLEFESDSVAQAQRRREMREAIDNMGEVNPNAVEEHAEQKERLDFYTNQREDLVKAIENLKRTIQRINQTSRKRFAETFDRVNEQFQKVIPILFGGGQAKLQLTDSDDVLDAGLDIVVRPPGKHLTNVSLLSGGEKALAAIGLIFSLFLIKPSPFCVLDEVDAPLDDSNIDRFNTLVRQMNEHSQIVLITHNKRTMEIAGRLYGVTMEEKGITKIVSVKIDQAASILREDS